jgi:hypothetical protein
MSTQAKAGEMLVGAYHKFIGDCDFVTYQKTSLDTQTEVDVVGVDLDGEQEIYACEVVTHLGGMGYGSYQENRDRLERKFKRAEKLVTTEYDNAEMYTFQLWSLNTPKGLVTPLSELADEFEDDTGYELELVMNDDYAERIQDLRDLASSKNAQTNDFAFRFLQIFEYLS